METLSGILIAAVVVGAMALALFGIASAWRRMMRRTGPLPLAGMVRQAGVSEGEARVAAGDEPFAVAGRRCAFCSSYEECEQRVVAGTPPPADCPNAALLAGLARSRA